MLGLNEMFTAMYIAVNLLWNKAAATKQRWCMKHICYSASNVHTNMQGNGHSDGRPQGETAANPLK